MAGAGAFDKAVGAAIDLWSRRATAVQRRHVISDGSLPSEEERTDLLLECDEEQYQPFQQRGYGTVGRRQRAHRVWGDLDL